MGKAGRKPIDISNTRYGRLVALKITDEKSKRGEGRKWVCVCDCGNHKVIRMSDLRSGKTKSCGCLEKENLTKISLKNAHGQTKTRLHNIWIGMKNRCNNKNNQAYKYYGGRGISVCDEWNRSYQTFHIWAINNGYNKNLTIDRIDVDGNYQPNNCKWSTRKEQSRNRRNVKKIQNYKEEND